MMTPLPTSALVKLADTPAAAPLVLGLHSLGLAAQGWQQVADKSASAFYAFDQRGHGTNAHHLPTSFADLVADAQAMFSTLADAAPDQPIHLVGHSLGGAVAASLAAKHASERLASLTLIATPFQGIPAFLERASAVRDQGMSGVIATTLERWFGALHHTSQGASREEAQAMIEAMQPEGFDGAWRALAQFGGYTTLPDIDVPTLVCSFSHDASTPAPVGELITKALAEKTPSVVHNVIEGAGHMGVLTHAQPLADVLGAHWAASAAQTAHSDQTRVTQAASA